MGSENNLSTYDVAKIILEVFTNDQIPISKVSYENYKGRLSYRYLICL
jgi:hypothetical protein